MTVTITDTTPPVIVDVVPSPAEIWPPNGKMRSVELGVNVTDNCSSAPVCEITSVTSNEPIGAGDWILTGELSLDLRAERLGERERPDLQRWSCV